VRRKPLSDNLRDSAVVVFSLRPVLTYVSQQRGI
jgi:hypothetical protein